MYATITCRNILVRYQFSKLFSEAWCKAIIPLSIINGFKYSGVYPLNPTVVLNKCPATSTVTENNDMITLSGTHSNSSNAPDNANCGSNENSTDEENEADFTEEEEAKFANRFEEGYDLYDPKYISWLKINHPAATLPATFTFVPPNFEQSCEISSSLESHSSTTDQAGDVVERFNTSNECPSAIVDCEQSPTVTMAKISSCNKTANRQVTKDILDSHISRENEYHTSSESESRTN